jgi:phytoene desaturase
MNYGDIKLGTWYPEGGMYKVVEALVSLAVSLGVEFLFDSPVLGIDATEGKVNGVRIEKGFIPADIIVASADYHHVEEKLLTARHRNYSAAYWDSRVLSPSSLIFFIGINTRLQGIDHHTLLFDEDLDTHATHIYANPSWPGKPALYLSCTSKSDETAAPKGMENLFVLIPVAPGLKDTEETREHYFQIILQRIQKITGQDISHHIVHKRSYAHRDFEKDFNAFKGNAYGLANTLMQTAFLKPKIMNKKLGNLFYAGQLTVPGPGVPPALISGQIVAGEIQKRIHLGKI